MSVMEEMAKAVGGRFAVKRGNGGIWEIVWSDGGFIQIDGQSMKVHTSDGRRRTYSLSEVRGPRP